MADEPEKMAVVVQLKRPITGHQTLTLRLTGKEVGTFCTQLQDSDTVTILMGAVEGAFLVMVDNIAGVDLTSAY